MVKSGRPVIALAGIPNSGKSSIFNRLTGGRAWVGNWPGVTVEKKIGRIRADSIEIEVVDLPGIYGLTAYSVDELIARNFILEENPDIIVTIANATNLERSLYLIISLLELGANVIVALNMIDLARGQGIEIDHNLLSKLLGVPVVPTVAISGVGIEELRKTIINSLGKEYRNVKIVDYGKDVEEAISKIENLIKEKLPSIAIKYTTRWLAIKLLEGDEEVIKKVKAIDGGEAVLLEVDNIRRELQEKIGDIAIYMAERRYQKVLEIVRKVVKQVRVRKVTWTDLLDSVLTHRVLGVFPAIVILYLLFRFAFEVSAPFVDLFDVLINGYLHDWVLGLKSLPSWLSSLLADGIIVGVGTVLTFLPLIVFFFLGLAFLEDVGYMSRIAYLVDKIFTKFGLSGKTIIPLVIGFGCNVPAVMAARTIEDENERKATALIAPLASCSARLPVYLVIASAIFGAAASLATLSMYIWSILLALVVGLALRKLLFKGPSTGFVMELPPYIMPRLGIISMKMWERSKKFLYKAGTVIFLGVLIVWALSVTGPSGFLGSEALSSLSLLEKSWAGVLGKAFSDTVFKPLGWDWRASAALIFGFIAKEVVVGTMAMLYGVGEEGLAKAIAKAHAFTPLTGYAYMLFVLVYVPCVATLATIRSELGLKYALLALAYELVLAYLLALGVVGAGHLVGIT
jgi:ferrous iron transport protein B